MPGAGGGELRLAVTRRPAERPAERIGSLVVNPGGPGISAVDALQSGWPRVPAAVRARFDLVALDPRGVGRSGAVDCATSAQLDRLVALDPAPDDARERRALERGAVELATGCARRSGDLLPQVGTAQVAEDVERLRAALGDERLTYLGWSYGTAIGAAYLSAHPDRVRALVLDGAVDPALRWDELLSGQAAGFEAALAALLQDCDRTRCAFRRVVAGDLGAAYDALAARVDRRPLGVGDRRLGPGEFSTGVGAGLYDREQGWPAVAAGLAAAQEGDGRPLLALADAYLERTADGYSSTIEANAAVNCLDREWPRDPEEHAALAARLDAQFPRFGAAIGWSGLPCGSWPVPPAPVTVAPPAGAPPVVVVGTTRDPATPYAWAVRLAQRLPGSVLLTRDGDGHTAYGADAPECLRRPVDQYLLTGRLPDPGGC